MNNKEKDNSVKKEPPPCYLCNGTKKVLNKDTGKVEDCSCTILDYNMQ